MVTGGGSRNSQWLQIYADVLESQLIKTNVDQQAATLGAATLALVGAGLWESFDQLESSCEVVETFLPNATHSSQYREQVLPRFAFAAQQVIEFSEFTATFDASPQS